MMRRTVLSFILCISLHAALAQTGTFLYLQSENNLPYEVKWNGKLFSSTSSGYLVIPQLSSGVQKLELDFGQAIAAPYSFSITVQDKPLGYSIRQSVTNKLSLFDMVTNTLINGNPLVPVAAAVKEPEKLILSKEEIEKQLAEKKLAEKNTAVAADAHAPATVPAVKPVQPAWQNPVKEVRKIFDRDGAEGVDQVYILSTRNRMDTIALFIPVLQDTRPKQLAMFRNTRSEKGIIPGSKSFSQR
jgi:hypothetical protein